MPIIQFKTSTVQSHAFQFQSTIQLSRVKHSFSIFYDLIKKSLLEIPTDLQQCYFIYRLTWTA